LIRRFGSLCLLLTLPAALAAAQSMGDVAKKERERREKLRQTGGGSVATVDDDQLAANKGTLANDTKQPVAAAGRRTAGGWRKRSVATMRSTA
jgi:hypothetical protein